MKFKRLSFLLGAALAIASGGIARAQDSQTEELKARIDRLEQQNRELLQYFQQCKALSNGAVLGTPGSGPLPSPQAVTNSPPTTPQNQDDIKKIVADFLNDTAAKNKAEEDAKKAKEDEEGYKIGSVMTMTAYWSNGLWLTTPNKDYTIHIGAWTLLDSVWFTQSPDTRAAQGGFAGPAQKVGSGAKLGGLGDMEDGESYRRIFPYVEGTFFDVFEYRLIPQLSNIQYATVGLDEMWVGINEIPWIGTVRFGHVKTPMGLEGDMTSSSRNMTFLERSAYSESIELNQNFVTGAWFHDAWFDDRATYTFSAFRQDLASSTGVFYGDGQWGMQGRLTALPLWEDDGRCYMHIGLSGGWRNGSNNLATSPDRTFELRARFELRDDDPAAQTVQPVPNSDDDRMIDTGMIVASNEWLMGLEYLFVAGPFSIQAEYGYNWLQDAIGANPSGTTLKPAFTSPQQYAFNGGYLQLAYTLTGESRAYDQKRGTLSRYYYGGEGPFNFFWFVRDDAGHYSFNWGAWEVAFRYSYVNLNDGEGLNRIQGGVLNGYSTALNWTLNQNVRFMFDYVYNQRSDVPPGSIPGQVQGLGVRVQFMF
jgi:phosphate-selective porin OprO and OprP